MGKTQAKKQTKPKRAMKMRRYRSPRTVPEKASLTVTKQFSLLSTNQSYRVYDVQLSQYARAVNVAKAYQLYRIKNCKLVLSPLNDTFVAGGSANVPYAYFQIDRTRDLENIRTSQEFKQLGCKPHRVDDNIIKFEWKPSVLNITLDNAAANTGVFNQYKVSPWVRTRAEGTVGSWNPDTTDHMGCVFLVENSSGPEVAYKMELIVEFEFCKPSYPTLITEGAPEPRDLISLEEPPLL